MASTPTPERAPAVAQPKARVSVPPCQPQTPERKVWPQGTLLWGTSRKDSQRETSSILASVELGRVRLGAATVSGVRLEQGRLVAASREPKALVSAVMQGRASDGAPVEVALCGAEAAAEDPSVMWYQIQVWDAEREAWENPCVATHRVPSPRALAVPGVWDEKGARHEEAGRFTFACENGVIAKCIQWGYKPWGEKAGYSLEALHQACTRMARADYCGDGRSHTREDMPIDMYDGLAVLTRTKEAAGGWEPALASFEAAWTADGAWCLSRTRDGSAVERILEECPARFEVGEKDLGEGDRCKVLRKGEHAEAVLLRNRSYEKGAPLRAGQRP
ncbi:ADYC domain-containing protein [Hyalangium rubrum]|uniref:ADYC domain-containing protein n=1 Tax=Hyalangium rubrum TaxID=3103134 RepID=A0ABU5GZ16_9BACT|nr:ADYC domain-containing protein [Hyalangium sp. s54d21]MDY7225070.1 ADYC domain-containing protein [Hyalangium sp. s54d21]